MNVFHFLPRVTKFIYVAPTHDWSVTAAVLCLTTSTQQRTKKEEDVSQTNQSIKKYAFFNIPVLWKIDQLIGPRLFTFFTEWTKFEINFLWKEIKTFWILTWGFSASSNRVQRYFICDFKILLGEDAGALNSGRRERGKVSGKMS